MSEAADAAIRRQVLIRTLALVPCRHRPLP